MVLTSLSRIDMQELVLCMTSLYITKKKLMLQGSLQCRLQIQLSFYRLFLPSQPVIRSNALWRVLRQSLSRSWHSDFDSRLLRIPDQNKELTAGVTGRQDMLTPCRHLIPLWEIQVLCLLIHLSN
jgi:hypothetical protein